MMCPTDEVIALLLEDGLDDASRRALLEHLDSCESCRQLVADTAEPLAGDVDLPSIGRYVVDRVLGAGAMGVVYAAHDPQLRRDVAIKLLKQADASDDALLREARTVASLSHPNVVTVYDADLYEGRIFVAMELVQGRTLRQWLGAGARPWRAIRDVFLQAGRGLAGAHAADLVHRDFKPDNVLVGDDGRVRVTDFGLARAVVGPEREGVLASSHALAGTPAYMPPEQRRGAPVDARADLYAYCVTLYEALYGQRPQADQAAPRRKGVPRRVRRALESGLRADPRARPASMEALLAELARGPLLTAARVATLLLVVLAIGGAAIASRRATRSRGPEPCTGAADAWGSIWGDADRQASARAFAATGIEGASDVLAHASASLAAYRTRWIAAHTQACLASRRGEQSADLLDRRMLCLGDRRKQAAAVVRLFEGADAKLVSKAVDLVGGLEPVATCDRGVGELTPPPGDRARLDELESRLADVKALFDASRCSDDRAAADAMLADARALGYAPLLARLLYYRGMCEDVHDRALALLHESAAQAESGHDDRTLALAWIRIGWTFAWQEDRPDEADPWFAYARAAIDRLGGDDELEMRWMGYRAMLLEVRGHFDEARAVLDAERAIAVRASGPDSKMVAHIESIAGNIDVDAMRWDDATAHFRRELEILERVEGPVTASIEAALDNLSVSLRSSGHAAEAVALFPRILAIQNAVDAGGDDSWVRGRYAAALRLAGDPARALDEARASVATCERFMGTSSVPCHLDYSEEALALLALGRPDEAVPLLRKAMAIQMEPDYPFTLALALEKSDPAGARAAALAAWKTERQLVEAQGGDRSYLDEMERWLAAHGGVPAR
jgi:tetratricopeptide (TPR) repeat protein